MSEPNNEKKTLVNGYHDLLKNRQEFEGKIQKLSDQGLTDEADFLKSCLPNFDFLEDAFKTLADSLETLSKSEGQNG